jgi:hypothetical protein
VNQGIFLSYRREDTGPYARLLQYELRDRIPSVPAFMDLDSIEPGMVFAEVIQDAVESCSVMVVLIGPKWATLTDEEGQRRLDDPNDMVRLEVETALKRDVYVIPVLVDGAKPLRFQKLPSALGKLALLSAADLSYRRYEYDADKLLGQIERIVAESARPPSRETAPAGDPAEAAIRRLEGSGVSPHIRDAVDGLRTMGYILKPAKASPGKRPENYLRIMDSAKALYGIGYLTPTAFSFSRTADRDRLKDLPGAWLISNGVNFSHVGSVELGLAAARLIKDGPRGSGPDAAARVLPDAAIESSVPDEILVSFGDVQATESEINHAITWLVRTTGGHESFTAAMAKDNNPLADWARDGYQGLKTWSGRQPPPKPQIAEYLRQSLAVAQRDEES